MPETHPIADRPQRGACPDRTDSAIRALRAKYPALEILQGPAEVSVYESDALTAFRCRPAGVVMATTTEQVIDVVRECHAHRVPFVARGSGTSLSGGSLPIKDGLVIALNRLNRILAYSPEDRTMVVEPGVINQQVSRRCSADGLYYAPDPSSGPVCTLGGNVAFNSGGAHCLKYGMTSNHVLAIKSVLPDGAVVQLGDDSQEAVGPDLVGMFVGSEGLFGIALEITLRLLPQPHKFHTVLAAYRSLAQAGDAVSRVVSSGLLPGALEIMDRLAMDAAEAAVQAGYPRDAAAVLIAELEGPEKELAAEKGILDQVIEKSGAYLVHRARDESERQRIWKGRKGAFSAVGRISPDYIVQDGVVPRSKLGPALERIEELSRQYSLRVANVFHAGDGNLHPLILYDGRLSGELERAEELAGEILRMCIHMDGSITGEHGVGVEKLSYLPEMLQPEDMALTHRIRQAVDPRELANRGKMLSVTEQEDREPRVAPASPARDPVAPTRTVERAHSVGDLQQLLRDLPRVRLRAGGTKSALSHDANVVLDGLRDIVTYDPNEFTITAQAGIRLTELAAALAENGQYLPFDPPLAALGATLGGTIAAGLSGPGRFRFGGARDFLLSVHLLTGDGQLIRGGAPVVKNAAGFDLPKLMIGSLGEYGLLIDLTLKVFPRPAHFATLTVECPDMESAVERLVKLSRSNCDLMCLELDDQHQLWLRIAGAADACDARIAALRQLVGLPCRRVEPLQEQQFWADLNSFAWVPPEHDLLKMPITPGQIVPLQEQLGSCVYHISAGGNLAWIACPEGTHRPELENLSRTLGRPLLALTGSWDDPWMGERHGHEFGSRIQRALDPARRFHSGS